MANIVSHPWTHAIQFTGSDVPGLISIEGFRTLLENTYEIRLGNMKKPSYVRNRAWLAAIANRDERPPVGYTTNVSSWKHEIGYTRPETAKWVCQNGQVFNKKGKNTTAPHTASEDLYILMTNVHNFHGHMGRDNFYNAVQKLSATPTKDFCNSFINSCCSKASMWIDGGLVNPHQLPVAVAKSAAAAAATAHVRPSMDAPIDNPPNNNNGVPLDNGVPFGNGALLNKWMPLENAVALEGMGLGYNPPPVNLREIADGMSATIGGGIGVDFTAPAPNWWPAAPVQAGQQMAYFPEIQYAPLPAAAPVQFQADNFDLDQFFVPNPAYDQPICRGRSDVQAAEQPSMEPSPVRGEDAQTGRVADYDENLDLAMSENLPLDQAMVDDLVANNHGSDMAVEDNYPQSLPPGSIDFPDFDMNDFVDLGGNVGMEAVEEAAEEAVEDFAMEHMEIDVSLDGELDLEPGLDFDLEDLDWEATEYGS